MGSRYFIDTKWGAKGFGSEKRMQLNRGLYMGRVCARRGKLDAKGREGKTGNREQGTGIRKRGTGKRWCGELEVR